MTPHQDPPGVASLAPGLRGPRLLAAAMVVFLMLTAVVTWPQVARLRDGIADVGDPLLNAWALAWVAHELPGAPAHVFDANIFHPERGTLAYSETLLAPAVLGAPFFWLGAGPVGVYNLLLFLGLAASGVGVAVLVHDLTGRRGAALVAGAVFAFLPFRFDHYSHFQLLQTQWMPLALWFLHRLVDRGRVRDGVGLGAMVGLQVMTSVYNAIFLGALLAVVGPVLIAWRGLSAARLRAVAVSVLVAGALSIPVAIAHLSARAVVGERGRDEASRGSAQLTDYLAAVPWNRLHGARAERFGGIERRLFPGTVVVLLALVALWPPLSGPRLAYLAGLAVTFELSRGFNGWLYPWLYDHTLLLHSLRVPARMGMVVGLVLAVLAGFGAARLQARLTARAGVVAILVMLGGVLADSWVAPIDLTTVPYEVPDVYADLMRDRGEPIDVPFVRPLRARQPDVLLELPLNSEVPTYMYYSTYHWQTLVNGYSGFFSDHYNQLGQALLSFPDDDAVKRLQGLQVRYVTLHGEFMSDRDYRRMTAQLDRMAPAFRLVSRRPWRDKEISLYRFDAHAR
ncbi:MAG: hypothetical protein U0802_25325 [Candidatus Binatia bacterium]